MNEFNHYQPRKTISGRIFADAPVASMLFNLRLSSTVRLTALLMALGLFAVACRRDPAAARQRFLASGDQYVAAGKFGEAVIQ